MEEVKVEAAAAVEPSESRAPDATKESTYSETSRQKGDKLKTLKCFPIVKNMIEEGVFVDDIARYIHEDAKEMVSIQRESLKRTIYRYLETDARENVNRMLPATMDILKARLNESIDPLMALNILMSVHMDRIMIEFTVEKKIGKTIKNNTDSIRVATSIAQAMSKVGAQDLSNRLRGAASNDTPKDTVDKMFRMKQSYLARYGEATTNVIMNPDSRRRVLNALERVQKGHSGPLFDILMAKFGKPDEGQTSTTIDIQSQPIDVTSSNSATSGDGTQ